MRVKSLVFFILFSALAALVYGQGAKTQILNSKHDFRAGSQATIRSTSSDQTCLFCHTPHTANPSVPLWNHKAGASTGPVYGSTTLRATIPQATSADSSKLCLSCHDGTVALGDSVNDGLIPFVQGSSYKLPSTSPSNLNNGSAYADDHPFAFNPVVGSDIQNPPAGDPVKLDGAGKVQCTSCHDPHVQSKDPIAEKFLVKSNARSGLCTTCHTNAGWASASHRQPASVIDDARYGAAQGAHTGYTGVANNGCESCHRPHTPVTGQRLIKFVEEQTCYKCHDGTVADTNKNIQDVFQTKMYRHPVSTTPSVHDASEGPASSAFRLPEISAGTPRHSECVDCHDPHAATVQSATPPSASGYLRNASGITSAGTGVTASQTEYQICFKCHGDSANKPQFFDRGSSGIGFGRNPKRQTDQSSPGAYNTRLELTSPVAWHPVVNSRGLSTGLSGEVPSLRAAPLGANGQPLPGRTLGPGSNIYCSDCHNNDSGRNVGSGTGPLGPHGSNNIHLLERTYSYNAPPASPGETMQQIPYSSGAYAICDKCHDLNGSTIQDQSFKEHKRHVVEKGASCAVCHDSHGINGGNAVNNSYLINFDLSIVAPDPNTGLLKYESTGFREGRCYLRCHGESHSPETYKP